MKLLAIRGDIAQRKLREPVKNYLADFFVKGAPLSGKSFFQKTLGGNGGNPPSLNRKFAKLFRNFFPKMTKNDVFVLNKVRNGPKWPNNRPQTARNV